MKKNLNRTAVLMTIATTILLGIIYPLVVTGLAQVLFPKQGKWSADSHGRKDCGIQHYRAGLLPDSIFSFQTFERGKWIRRNE